MFWNSTTHPKLQRDTLYRPGLERDACGVGMIANLNQDHNRKLIVDANTMLRNMSHRGGCGLDERCGDGAGILTNIPHSFFANTVTGLPASGAYGVGNVFFGRDTALNSKHIPHGRGKKIRAHAASRRSIIDSAWAGVDIIDHADRMDTECIDAILEAGSSLAPTLLFSQRFLAFLQGMLDQGVAMGASYIAEGPAERHGTLRRCLGVERLNIVAPRLLH